MHRANQVDISAQRCPRDRALLVQSADPVHRGVAILMFDLLEGQGAIKP